MFCVWNLQRTCYTAVAQLTLQYMVSSYSGQCALNINVYIRNQQSTMKQQSDTWRPNLCPAVKAHHIMFCIWD